MPYILGKRSLDNLEGVHPHMQTIVHEAIKRTEQDFTVIEGLRTLSRQKELVAKGVSWTLNSRHLTGHAVDMVPYPITKHLKYPHVQWQDMADAMFAAANYHGYPLEWGYTLWGKDKPHFQLPWSDYRE